MRRWWAALGLRDASVGLLILAVLSYAGARAISQACQGPRIGAICRDGWHSHAVGRGACSHHGGVQRWIYAKLHPDLEKAQAPLTLAGHAGLASAAVLWLISGRKGAPRREVLVTRTEPPRWPSDTVTDEVCPRCGAPLVRHRRKRDGQPFFGCSRFPRCRFTRDLAT